ncbi:uncharacterized protein [Henckelia pumila]|uniref:uncharacterized protein n=1 Tax=Henckelia pumila TaxID=405737 RepID=UPI003C6E4BD0
MSDNKESDKQKGDVTEKSTTPYHLSANDNPGNIITQVQLGGKNYDEWARVMRTALRAKKKFGFIDALRSTITYQEIAKELWDDIKERLSIGNGPLIQKLKSKLIECKQQGMAIMNYYGKLKMIWEELDRPRGSGRGVSRGQGGQKPSVFARGRGRNGQFRANTTQVTALESTSNGQPSEADKHGLNGLSSEQWNMLVNLLNNQKEGNQGRLNGKKNELKWIIDTGASHHMTGNLDTLIDVQKFMPCRIGLRNGKEAVATKEGSLTLDAHLKLKNDHRSRMLIGVGEQLEGLYYFRGLTSNKAMQTTKKDTMDLWHRRLGHPSGKIIRLLSVVYDNSDKAKPFKVYVGHFDDFVTEGDVEEHAEHVNERTADVSLKETSETVGNEESVVAMALTASIEPSSFSEAMKDEKWRHAMNQEIRALEDNSTWDVVSLPPGKRAIHCKWVYKIKYKADGTIERYKARLVILGNRQVEEIDYNETFAPVAKMVTVRTFLAVAAARNWELHQMDVHNAFLHGDLEEKVYMHMPPGFHPTKPGMINVLVYVDDIIVSGNDHAAIEAFKAYLSKCFYMKDLGILKYFLGIEVARGPDGIFLSQRKYSLDIISETGLLGAKPASLPLEQQHNLALANGDLLSEPEHCRRLVGRLIYLSVTRPELSYCVHTLAQFMQQPRDEHWESALRVVRYLKGNPGKAFYCDQNVIYIFLLGVTPIGQVAHLLVAL